MAGGVSIKSWTSSKETSSVNSSTSLILLKFSSCLGDLAGTPISMSNLLDISFLILLSQASGSSPSSCKSKPTDSVFGLADELSSILSDVFSVIFEFSSKSSKSSKLKWSVSSGTYGSSSSVNSVSVLCKFSGCLIVISS